MEIRKFRWLVPVILVISVQLIFTYIQWGDMHSTGVLGDDYAAMLKLWAMLDLTALAYKAANIKEHNRVNTALSLFIFALAPLVTVLCTEHELVYSMSYRIVMYEALCLLCCQLVLYALSSSRWASYLTATLLYIVLLCANRNVTQYRGVPIRPQDIYSVNTLFKVVGNYSLKLTAEDIKGAVTLVTVALPLYFVRSKAALKGRLLSLVLAAACVAVVNVGIRYDNFRINDFNPRVEVSSNGLIVNFFRRISALKLSAPEGYTDTAAEALYNEVEAEQAANAESTDTGKLPHIIVVMNESFSDLGVLGDINTSEDYMPNFKALKSESLSGNMLVSAFGGNTANTEFEFLTGLTTAFLPEGSVAYNQYITRRLPSVATWLKSLGYRTEALHPFEAQSWNRELVYDRLGFDDFISIEDMNPALNDGNRDKYTFFDIDGAPYGEQYEYVRSLLSDKEDYRELIKLFEERQDGDRMFLFNVTIQNHGGYDVYTNGFTNEVQLKGKEGKYSDVEQYLTLIKKSDEALKELVDYFRTVDEPVVLVFFGDHQPSLDESFYTEVIKDKSDTESDISKHIVPYMIWYNKGVDKSKEKSVISPNMLMPYALTTANVPTSSFMNSLIKLNTSISAMNDKVYVTIDGKTEVYGEDSDEMREYRFYQYYSMFR